MAIRYDKKLNKEISKVVRNFNSKVERLSKKRGEGYGIPQKIKTTDLKKEYFAREELKRRLKELKAFSKRGSEEIIETSAGKMTRWEYEVYEQERKRALRSIRIRKGKLERERIRIAGREQFLTFAQAKDTQYLNLLDKEDILKGYQIKELERGKRGRRRRLSRLRDDIVTPSTLESVRKAIRVIRRLGRKNINYAFKGNLIRMINNLSYFYEADGKKTSEIMNSLKGLSAEELYDLYSRDRAIKAILDFYKIMKKNGSEAYKTNKRNLNNLINSIYDRLDEIFNRYKK